MAKGKNKKLQQNGTEPSLHTVPNRDLMLRMNFLYQVAAYLTRLPEEPRSSRETPRDGRDGQKQQRPEPGTYQHLARAHIRTMRHIGQKSMVKMDPSVKRTVCRICNSILIPAITSRTRVKSSKVHRHVISQACTRCGEFRHTPAPPRPRSTNEEIPAHPNGDDQQVLKNNIRCSSPDVRDTRVMTGSHSGPQRGKTFYRNPPSFESDNHFVYRGSERLQ